MSSTKLAALTLAATAFAASGCGGSSKSATPATTATSTAAASTTAQTPATSEEIKVQSGTPLSKAVWIKKGDAICGRTNAKLKSVKAQTPQEIGRLLPQTAAYEHIEAVELSKLVPPRRQVDDWQQIIAGIQKFSVYSVQAAVYARANHFQDATPLAKAADKVQRQLTAIAKRNGFKVCSAM
jgi:hypothetical protein